jgi:Fur family ferric uptake transcriptional regulator
MATRHRPATLAELAQAPGLDGLDQATVYRLVMKLEVSGLVRRLGLHERSTHFQLVIPGHHHDYLVCTQCGKIEDLDLRCPVEALEKGIMEQHGYRGVYHELEFYGVCPQCGGAG